MSDFKKFRRKQIAELRAYVPGEMLPNKVSISSEDIKAGSPKEGDMIARNPLNHNDQWLVAKKYFEDNFESIELVADGEVELYPDIRSDHKVFEIEGHSCITWVCAKSNIHALKIAEQRELYLLFESNEFDEITEIPRSNWEDLTVYNSDEDVSIDDNNKVSFADYIRENGIGIIAVSLD